MTKPKKKKSIKKSKVSTNSTKKKGYRPTYPFAYRYTVVFFVTLFGFLLYTNTIGHEYALDDFSAIKENYVTKQGVEGIPTIWKEHYRFGYWNSKAVLYRPMTLTVFALVWEISPDNPALYHFVNAFLYGMVCYLIFLTFLKMWPKTSILFPFWIAILFAAHPLHVEVVANIKSLDEIMALGWGVFALDLTCNYVNRKKHIWIYLSALAYAFAVFSKESAIPFLGVFPLFLYFFTKVKPSKIAFITGIHAIPIVLYLILRIQIVGGLGIEGNISFLDNVMAGAESKVTELATAFLFLGKYLVNLIAPYNLAHDYGYNQVPLTSFGDCRVLLSAIAYFGIGGWAIWKMKDKHVASFGILFFLGTFALLSNIFIPNGTSYGDRIMFMPSLGFCIAFVWLVFYIFKTPIEYKNLSFFDTVKVYKYPCMVLGIITLLFASKTISRNTVWKNSFTLYQEDINRTPNSAKLNYHYGLELVKKGLDATTPKDKNDWLTRAENQFKKAIEIYPKYHDAYGQLGLSYYRKKDYDTALQEYAKAIEYKPNSPKVYSNMGIIYFERGQVDKAQEVYEKAVKIDPRYVDARRNLGSVYARKGNFPAAVEQFSEALKYSPDDPTIIFYLGSSLRDSGQAEQGRIYLEKACRLDSSLCK